MARTLKRPDAIAVKDQLQALQAMLKCLGPEAFCAAFFWILSKQGDAGGRIVPFTWNRVQKMIFPKLGRNNRVLKARQPGFTTFFLLVRLFLPVITEGGKGGLLVSQNGAYATQHFVIVRRAYRLIGAVDPYDNTQNELCLSLRANLLHTVYANRKELYFDQLDSKLLVESAEVEEAGQGVTLHHVVASEAPRWPKNPESTISNIKGALVPGGTFDEEGTANGAAGYFFERYIASMNAKVPDAVPHFFAWYETDEFMLDMTEKEKDEMLLDLQADELALIAKMHRELSAVTWMGNVTDEVRAA